MSKNFYNNIYHDKLIDLLFNNFKNEINVNILKINLNNNTYIIDHDHKGNKLVKNKIVYENDIQLKKYDDDSTIKTYQYIYNDKSSIIILHYNIDTMNLVAYKENNKMYKLNYNTDNNLILNYSVKFKLKMLGYTTIKYKIEN